MKHHYTIISLLVFAITFSISVNLKAVNYPIQVSTMVAPPYSLKLSDYVESGYDRVQVNIVPLDMNLVSYKVKLKLIIESYDGRVRIETDPNYVPSPVYLQGGVTEILTSYDLQQLFNINNLIFKGYSKTDYLRKNQLPENFYRIGIELVDYNRASARTGNDVVVSNFGFSTVSGFLNDPPILNLPQNKLKISIFDPQQIIFQWTPRHKASPNSAFNAAYTFKLYEVWNENASPNMIASTQSPIYETEVYDSRLLYGVGEPMLIPGKKYVWTVRVHEEQNRDLFRNSGQSEAFMFTYGEECKAPQLLKGEAVNGPGLELNWNGSTGHTSYTIEYRPSGSTTAWYKATSNIQNARVYELQYNKSYEIKAKAECGNFESPYSKIITLSTPAEPKQNFSCGTNKTATLSPNTGPLTVLAPGMLFTAGGFQCKVTAVTASSGGLFSGECLVTIPYYGYAKVLHKFEGISLNTDYQMLTGKLISVTDKSKEAAFMAKVDKERSKAIHGTGYTDEQLKELLGANRVITLEETISKIEATPEGNLLVTYANGETETIEVKKEEKVVVSDGQGNQYVASNGVVVDGNAAIAAASGNNGSGGPARNVDSLLETLQPVRFAPVADAKNGFDSLQYDALKLQYEQQVVLNNQYVVPYKAIETGNIDYVYAVLPSTDEQFTQSLTFHAGSVPVVATPAERENMRKLNISTVDRGDGTTIEATYTLTDTAGNAREETVGLMKLAVYDKQKSKVYLVPLDHNDSYDSKSIQTIMNQIYNQAVCEWEVVLKDPFMNKSWDINNDDIFDDTDMDERMNYTQAMKNVYKAYDEMVGIEDDAYYLFLVNSKHKSQMDGYMPIGKQFGFIFVDNDHENLAKNVAHELGHGAFNLFHSFSKENMYTVSEGSTKNLMDYTNDASATLLNKFQWDFIHDPQALIISALQDEEEGAFGGSWTILDNKHTQLFNHVYDNNNVGSLNYLEKIKSSRVSSPDEISLDLEYKETEEKAWINTWKLRTSTSDEILAKIIKKIQDAEKDKKIEKMSLNEKGIYIGKYKLDDVEYPIAIYSEKADISNITKVQVSEVDELDKDENKKHIKSEETLIKYLIVAFYEDNVKEPALVIQIEKFDYSKLQNTKEKWLSYLEILVKENDEESQVLPGNPLVKMEIVGTIESSNIGGTYGCTRYTDDPDAQNCDNWKKNITNFPSVTGKNKVHDGVDLLAPTGTPVYAMFDGDATVNYSSDLGNYILIKSTKEQHNLKDVNDIIWVSYGHLSKTENLNGKKVKQGQLIGYTGNTGTTAKGISAWRYHLHLTVYKGGTDRYNRVNPTSYLTTKFDSNGNKID